MTEISPAVLRWFGARGISEATVRAAGIYSGRRQPTGDGFDVVPDAAGEVICYPYIDDNGEIVAEKYRERGKRFWQKKGGKKVFYGCEVLSDSQLIDGRAALVIVEGEMDRLAVVEAGNPFVVSVPDGAPPALNKPRDVAQFDPDHDTKYTYIAEHWEHLKKIKRVIIATDDDAPGQRLAEELVRRLGRSRCSFVKYPPDCKDFNDVLLKHGPAAVWDMLHAAKEYPVSGVYDVDELPKTPDLVAVSTGFRRLDEHIKVFFPGLMVVTGFAGSGKSTWVNQMVAHLAIEQGWRTGIASFEMMVDPFILDTLKGTYRLRWPKATDDEAIAWIKDNFKFICPECGDDNETFDIEWLIDRAITAVVRKGIRVLVIDPWNEIEHAIARGETHHDYIGRAIRSLKRFAREFGCLVIVVAHPTKRAAEKTSDQLSLYDVSDSAHFANKADFGVIIKRCNGDMNTVSEILVRKIRYQKLCGVPGSKTLTYSLQDGVFSQ